MEQMQKNVILVIFYEFVLNAFCFKTSKPKLLIFLQMEEVSK